MINSYQPVLFFVLLKSLSLSILPPKQNQTSYNACNKQSERNSWCHKHISSLHYHDLIIGHAFLSHDSETPSVSTEYY